MDIAATPILIEEFELLQNYPNPFNPVTTIKFNLPVASVVTLEIFDIIGRRVVETLHATSLPAGNHKHVWNATDAAGQPLASGLYFYQLSTETFVATRKMLLNR